MRLMLLAFVATVQALKSKQQDDASFWTQSLDCPQRPTGTSHFLTPDGSNAADVLGIHTGAFLTILHEHLDRTPCIFARLANTVRPFRFKRFVIVVDSAEKTAAGTARATARLDAFDRHWLNATCAFADEVRVAVLDHGPTPNALASTTLARVTTNATEVWRRRGELYKNALQYLALVSGVLLPLRYVFNVDEELSLGWLETGSPRTVEAPFSAFLATAVREFARSSWFAGYSVQECVRGCDDPRCSFSPHHGRWVFEAALFHVERLSGFIQKRPLAYEELFAHPEAMLNRWSHAQHGAMLNAKLGEVCRVARSLRGECDAAVLSGPRGRCVRKDGRRLVLHWEAKGEYACVLDAPYNVTTCHRGEC